MFVLKLFGLQRLLIHLFCKLDSQSPLADSFTIETNNLYNIRLIRYWWITILYQMSYILTFMLVNTKGLKSYKVRGLMAKYVCN